MVEIERQTILSKPLLKESLRISCPGLCPDDFGVFPRVKTQQPLRTTYMSECSRPHKSKVHPDVRGQLQRTGQCERTAEGHVALPPCSSRGIPEQSTARNLLRSSQRPSLCDHWQEPASVLFAPFRQVFLNSHEIPLNLLSGLRSSNSISLQVKCSTPFNSLRAIYQMHFSSPTLRSSEPHTRLYKPHLCPSARI